MKIIVGLGNPGDEYKNTRHNIGFKVLEHLQYIWQFPKFKEEKKFKAFVSEGNYNNEKMFLVKPLTFMNLSGESISLISNFYKINSENIIVAQDDLDMDIGKIRYKKESGSGGHNGIKSLVQKLGSNEFHRIKLGISNNQRDKIPAEHFVLQKFKTDEEEIVTDMIIASGNMIEELL